jgi:2'-5' RNA ligase
MLLGCIVKRRIFVAVALSQALQEQIIAWQERHHLPVRWIKGKNLHITLVPPWYEEDLERVKESLGKLCKHTPFSIALNTVEFGPPRQPRLIWATGDTTKEMLELKEHVEAALGIHSDQKFKLHVTIARFRPEDFRKMPVKKLGEKVDWKEQINSIVLMESHLTSAGADYEVLEEIKFGNI